MKKKSITRRDFLNGVAVSVTASADWERVGSVARPCACHSILQRPRKGSVFAAPRMMWIGLILHGKRWDDAQTVVCVTANSRGADRAQARPR